MLLPFLSLEKEEVATLDAQTCVPTSLSAPHGVSARLALGLELERGGREGAFLVQPVPTI